MQEGTIAAQWAQDDGARQAILDKARFCAALTKPWYLPPQGHDPNSQLPETFSSLAARGITNLEGRLLLALYPPGLPFFRFMPAAKFLYDKDTPPETIQEFKDLLHLRELVALAKLEAAAIQSGSNARRTGFRSMKRMAIGQILVTGDTLERLDENYRLRVYRRDHYVTSRDSVGNVRYHIVKESIDPLVLTDEQLVTIDLKRDELRTKNAASRSQDLYTMTEWQPEKKVWVVKQEIKEKTILEFDEKVSSFMSTPYELAPGENYGRGIIELNLGDVRSINELTEKILDFAALASKLLMAMDYNAQTNATDLAKSTGSVIQARVVGGVVQDIGMIKTDKIADFKVVQAVRESIRKDLAAVMLMEAENQPKGDRVTAFQVQRVALELEGALGGVFAPIADSQQVPLIERTVHQMERDRLLVPLPEDTVEVEALTGIAALSRENDQGKLLSTMGAISQLGPETVARIDKGVLVDVLMRQSGVFEPGLVKTDEQIAEEQQAAADALARQEAVSKAIDVGGNAVESAATQEEPNG